MTRAENVARVTALKAEGLNGIQIAKRMGISRSYAYELLADPEGNAVRARKDSYRGTCVDCGTRTNGSNGRHAPERCLRCAAAHNAKWTRETVLAALLRWNELHGRPPGAQQWQATLSTDYPSTTSVLSVFGTWNAAIVAAGFVPMVGGHKRIELLVA